MLSLGLVSSLLFAAAPAAGATAPDFTATDTEGASHQLSKMVKDGTVLVAFFPKAFTGGCTKEMTAYHQQESDVKKSGATLLAVSMDDADTLKKFKASVGATFTFLPDPEGRLAKLFDVKAANAPYAQRYTFVIGPDLKVLKVQEGSDAIDPSGALAACPLHKAAPTK